MTPKQKAAYDKKLPKVQAELAKLEAKRSFISYFSCLLGLVVLSHRPFPSRKIFIVIGFYLFFIRTLYRLPCLLLSCLALLCLVLCCVVLCCVGLRCVVLCWVLCCVVLCCVLCCLIARDAENWVSKQYQTYKHSLLLQQTGKRK